MRETFRTELEQLLGREHVLIEPDTRSGYEVDWTGRFGGAAHAVLRPASTAQVAAALALCNEHRVPVIAQGGNTGLVGGGVPRPDGPRPVIMSTRRLTSIGDVDRQSRQVTLGAGVTLAQWQRCADDHGLAAPVDFAARDTATIGGAIATNAGGSRVVRFGTMRSQVAGIEAVLADGSVIGHLSGLPKDASGVHWPSVLTGSEGTFAVITRARLRLVSRFEHRTTAWVTFASLSDAVAWLPALRTLDSLDAVEVLDGAATRLAAAHIDASPPTDLPRDAVVVLVECAAAQDPSDDLSAALDNATNVIDSAVATDPVRSRQLMTFRDRMTEAIAGRASDEGRPVFKLDVAVPVGHLDRLLDVARAAAADDGCELFAFGHLAEGNLHLNHVGVNDPDRLAERVLQFVATNNGAISAEHGIGVAKSQWLHLVRSATDLRAQAALRRSLDPHGLMNPGVLDEV